MAKLIKSTQVSACDNEQLSIKCNEDYYIDVIAVEHTIITVDNVKDTRVNNQSSSTTIRKLPNSLLMLSDSNLVVEQQEQAVCQQAPPTALQLSSSSSSLSSPSGNGTNTTINMHKNGTEPGICDQNQAQALASSKDIAALVRNECRSRNTCTLDLRWPRAANNSNSSNNKTDSVESATNGTTQRMSVLSPTTNQALGLRANGFRLSKLFNEPCPGNRKLMEIVYKCRPMKMNKRIVCRNSQLHLECPNEKKLVVISGDYGAWANDTKNHEKCSTGDPSSSSSSTTTKTNHQAYSNDSITDSSTLPGPLAVAQSAALSKSCLVNSLKTMSVLASNCLYRRTCDLPVTPAIFGDAQCPVGQAEYLKMVYICVNSTLLIDGSLIGNLSIFPARPTTSTTIRGGSQQDAAQPFFISSSVSSLLSSPITTTNNASQVSSQQQIADMSNDQQIAGGGGRYRSLGNTLPSSGGQFGASETQLNDMYDEPSAQPPNYPYETRKVTLISAVGGDPTKYSQIPPLAHYSQINVFQRLRDLFAKYQSPLLFITLSIASTMLFVVMLLSCRLKSSAGSNSSSVSKDSTCSTKSSTTGFKSYGSSGSSSHGGAQLHSGSSNTKHNSCSESCFSLDDYNFNTGSNGNHSLDSPAPNSSNTPLDSNNNNMEVSSNFGAQSLVRPKLWTIYNNAEQVTNPLRMSSTQHHHTMRPTRSFVGQQQVSQIHQLRTLHCVHQQNQNQSLQQQQQQQLVQQSSTRDSLSSAHDLLLQTAPIPQQAVQHQISNHQQATANWCATLNQQVQQHLQESPQQQIDSQAQIIVGAPISQLHHQINNTMAPPQQCAFHQSQSQNQQQLILQEPQNIPLEYSQPGTATILASHQQQQQQQQLQQSQQQLQQQQQAALDARQFHPNFHHHT